MVVGFVFFFLLVGVDAAPELVGCFGGAHDREPQTVGGVSVLLIPTAIAGARLDEIREGDAHLHLGAERQRAEDVGGPREGVVFDVVGLDGRLLFQEGTDGVLGDEGEAIVGAGEQVEFFGRSIAESSQEADGVGEAVGRFGALEHGGRPSRAVDEHAAQGFGGEPRIARSEAGGEV